ncbi:MAG TPA: SDR family NAD(P)-dependent oxidoreductase [bacterium]|nr:SDR family NAD(P)-dependent oxidoreductase [bacterium]
MKYVVTGAAGFIGSHLCERLLGKGDRVIAVDCFTDYYERALKEKNAEGFRDDARCEFIEADVNDLDLKALVKGCDGVYHLAAQAGVRASWGQSFDHYLHHNVRATQRFLEAVKDAGGPRLVYASSSSVYGDTAPLPARETNPTRPRSPYGVSKLACEHLADLYRANHGVDAIGLRYFTVYGPRQRPDMAFNRFIRALFREQEIAVYGDGKQSRDFTFVADIVEGTMKCMEKGVPGRVYNIGGGHRTVLMKAIEALAAIVGTRAKIRYQSTEKGDVRDTSADTSLLRAETGYAPATRLEDGLRAQVEWQRKLEAL